MRHTCTCLQERRAETHLQHARTAGAIAMRPTNGRRRCRRRRRRRRRS